MAKVSKFWLEISTKLILFLLAKLLHELHSEQVSKSTEIFEVTCETMKMYNNYENKIYMGCMNKVASQDENQRIEWVHA